MDKKKIVEYVMHTPRNTNRAVLSSMLDQLYVPTGGADHSMEDGLIEGTITEYVNDRVTSIGANAFRYNQRVQSVSFSNVTHIGEYGFSDMENLTSASLPKAEIIDQGAFAYASSLKDVYIPSAVSVGAGAFFRSPSLTELHLPKVETLGERVFEGCESLTSLYLDSIKEIPTGHFMEFESLTSIHLPQVERLGESVFYGCKNLTKIDLPKATLIRSGVFYACTSLVEVSFGQPVMLQYLTFYSCNSLQRLIFRSESEISSLSAGTEVFNKDGVYPEGITVYVPSALVDAYNNDSVWNSTGFEIRALEDYTVDGTVTGELDLAKI